MVVLFIGFICGITAVLDFIDIRRNCDKTTGVTLGISGDCSEVYQYDYKGKHHFSRGFRPGFHQKANQEYPIWVYRDAPERVVSNKEFLWIKAKILLIPITIFLMLDCCIFQLFFDFYK